MGVRLLACVQGQGVSDLLFRREFNLHTVMLASLEAFDVLDSPRFLSLVLGLLFLTTASSSFTFFYLLFFFLLCSAKISYVSALPTRVSALGPQHYF